MRVKNSTNEELYSSLMLEADNIPGDSGYSMDVKPEWFNEELFQKGRRVGLNNSGGTMLSLIIGTAMMSQCPNLMEPQLLSRTFDHSDVAKKRIANTIDKGTTWVTGDIWDSKDPAYISIRKIRNLHHMVVRRMGKTNMEKPGGGIWFSQLDMSLALFSIIGPAILYPEKLGYVATTQELDSFIFLWRCIGHQFGMLDEFNLCRGTYNESRQRCVEIIDYIVKPSLLNPNSKYEIMLTNIFGALKSFSFFVDKNMFVNFTFELMDLPAPIALDLYGKICMSLVKTNVKLNKIGPYRTVFGPWYKALVNRWVQQYFESVKKVH